MLIFTTPYCTLLFGFYLLFFPNLNAWYNYQENTGYSNESSRWQSSNFEVTQSSANGLDCVKTHKPKRHQWHLFNLIVKNRVIS